MTKDELFERLEKLYGDFFEARTPESEDFIKSLILKEIEKFANQEQI